MVFDPGHKARVHKHISYWKSGIRLLGYIILMAWVSPIAGAVLLVSEVLGVAEEVWGT